MTATHVQKKQKLFAAAGAAVMAVYQSLSASPTGTLSPDEEASDDIYSSPTAWDTLDTNCDIHYVVEAALATVTATKNEMVTNEELTNEEVTVDCKVDCKVEMEDSSEKPESGDWFSKHLLQVSDNESWIQQMRMTRTTFLCLVNHLEPTLKRETKWNHIAVGSRVGVSIYRLVNASGFEELGEKFAIDSKEAQGVIEQTVKALNSMLGHLIKWPTGQAMQKVIQGFQDKCFLPNCCGSIDGCDIEIKGTNPNYRNKKGTYSVILQAVCDTQSKFLDVMCGWSGRTHQTRVLRNSKLFERVNRGKVLAGPRVPINGAFLLRQYVVGDGEYPSVPWLITPYSSGPGLIYSHKCFNKKHEQARRHIKQAFSTLKSTFTLLGQPMEDALDFVPHLIFASCILHNLIIDSREAGIEFILDAANTPDEVDELEAHTYEENASTIRGELTEMIALST